MLRAIVFLVALLGFCGFLLWLARDCIVSGKTAKLLLLLLAATGPLVMAIAFTRASELYLYPSAAFPAVILVLPLEALHRRSSRTAAAVSLVLALFVVLGGLAIIQRNVYIVNGSGTARNILSTIYGVASCTARLMPRCI